MADTASSLADVLKDAWHQNRLKKQFYTEHGPFSRFQEIDGTMMGNQVQVGIWAELGGGYTSVGPAGGSLNTYNNQTPDQAVYTLVGHWQPISIDTSALVQASGNNLQALIGSKDMAIEGGVEAMRRQATRQLVTNGDSIVAQCDTGGASATVELLPSPSGSAYGFDAMQRNWLRKNVIVDIGTTADTDALVTGTTITSIKEDPLDPDITIGTSISTVSGTHFVYIANPNSATAPNVEMNGLRNIVNTSGALGGLNPATAGEEFWAAAARDTTTTVFSLDLALNLDRQVKQKSGEPVSNVWTSLKQQLNFYSLLQNQVRFAGDMKMGAGKVNAVQWNGMEVEAFNDILDSDWYHLTLSDLARIHGSQKAPQWASEIQGSNKGSIWVPGTTRFEDAVSYYVQLGITRRNTHAAATALTA